MKEFGAGLADCLLAHQHVVFAADNGWMDNRLPLSILFVALVALVVPFAVGLYLRGHMDLAAVLRNAGLMAG